MTARSPQRQQLMDLLAPVVSAEGYDLEDVSVTAAGRRSLIRITVDSDQGIDLDGVADVSRAISGALDDDTAGEAAFAGPYVLEVSSPGVDRPLTEPRHWRRATGRLVTVDVTESGTPASTTGRILAADDRQLELDVEGASRRFDWDAVGAGRVQVEFSRPGEPIPDDEPADDEPAPDDEPADELALEDESAPEDEEA
ncbi:MAG: ribosome maturation factor RimP [Actinomycetota bacterium]|nr:ribosome maturation factor RimP [Actinomycetota bacterium]